MQPVTRARKVPQDDFAIPQSFHRIPIPPLPSNPYLREIAIQRTLRCQHSAVHSTRSALAARTHLTKGILGGFFDG